MIFARRDQDRLDAWLGQLRPQRPPAIVLGASVNGLSFVRSLGRRSVPSLLLDSARSIGTSTRHAQVFLLPPPDENSEKWACFFRYVGERLPVPAVLFITSDAHGLLVARQAGLLRPYYRFIIPDADTMQKIVDKHAQYVIANAAGIPIPKTSFPDSEESVRRLAQEVEYPCILKPYVAHTGRKRIKLKVLVVSSPAELIEKFTAYADSSTKFMVQEIIPGDDTNLYGYLAFWDNAGVERCWVTKRKLRQHPPLYGDGSLQITVDAPEVLNLSRLLLRSLEYEGFVGIEFKYDARDGSYRLMEINPRTVSGNQLPISAGVDFPWLGYQYLTGANVDMSSVPKFASGVKYMNEEWDLKAYLALRKSGKLTLTGWLRSLRGVKARAIWAWDDPAPFLQLLWRLLFAALRSAKSRIFGKR